MENLDLHAFKKELEDQLVLLAQQNNIGQLSSRNVEVINPDRADLAIKYDQRERKIVLESKVEKQIREIEEALNRLEEGSFGACVECGTAIAAGRLRALPYASSCIQCQKDHEKIIGLTSV
jgi:RNA polymerase-binding protein DksA